MVIIVIIKYIKTTFIFYLKAIHHQDMLEYLLHRASTVGLEKAQLLANQQDVSIKTRLADLTTEDLGHETWDLIVSIFFHLPTADRHALHQRIARALRPGGRIILEAYTPAQLSFKTGGPSRPEMLMSLPLLQADFAGLAIVHAIELERDVVEGAGHIGRSAVVQFIAEKPIQ